MVDGLTGNILASLEAASEGFLSFYFFQPSTFCSHWKYVVLCLSSGGSSEPVKDMVEKVCSCMVVFAAVTAIHCTVVMSQCVCVSVCVLKCKGLFSINLSATLQSQLWVGLFFLNRTLHVSCIHH